MFWRPKQAKSFTKAVSQGITTSYSGIDQAEAGVRAAKLMMDRENRRMTFHTEAANLQKQAEAIAVSLDQLKADYADVF